MPELNQGAPAEPDDNTLAVGLWGGGAEGEGSQKLGPLIHLGAWGSGSSPTGIVVSSVYR